MIKVQCRRCKWRFAVLDEMLGMTDRCPQCGEAMAISAQTTNAPEPTAIVLWRTFILTEPSLVAQRIGKDALDRYLRSVDVGIRDLLAGMPRQGGADLTIKGALLPPGKLDCSLYMLPPAAMFNTETLRVIFQRLFALPVPPVQEGNVEFSIFFSLWGGSGLLIEVSCGAV
jgi:hypothetical protein